LRLGGRRGRSRRRELHVRELRLGRERQLLLPLFGAMAQRLAVGVRGQVRLELGNLRRFEQAVHVIEHQGFTTFPVEHGIFLHQTGGRRSSNLFHSAQKN